MTELTPPLVLAAHGSRDPAAALTVAELAARVARRWPAPVVAAFLDFARPSIPDTLAIHPSAVVVPCLLTDAYHGRVDLPAVLASSPWSGRLAPVLGPDPLLVGALRRRLSAVSGPAPDAVVLLAAGTSDDAARSTVDGVARALGQGLSVPWAAGYASAGGRTVTEAVEELRAAGAARIFAASYFLAPGRLSAAAARSAVQAGAIGVAGVLGAADEVVQLVLTRARAATRVPQLVR